MVGTSKDELFGQYFGALEKIHYFKNMPDGNDDQVQLDKATHIFHKALEVLEFWVFETCYLKNVPLTNAKAKLPYIHATLQSVFWGSFSVSLKVVM